MHGRPTQLAVLLVVLAAAFAASAVLAIDLTTTDGATSGEHADRVTTPRSVSIVAGGEIIAESAVRDAAARAAPQGQRFDFTPLLSPIAATVSAADLAICHLELPIGAPGAQSGLLGRSPFGGNRLLAPYELAAAVASTGFDRCSTASNHSDDAGSTGIVTTLDALDAAGVEHAGTARTAAEHASQVQPTMVGGVRISHLAYTRGSNNVQLAGPWVNYSPTIDEVAGDVAAARRAGAELVIVSIHVLPELSSSPAPADRTFVTQLTATTSIDLVVMHGSHVVQPPELVNATTVFWGLGNMLSGMGVAGTGRYMDKRTLDGLLAAVEFTETAPGVFTPRAWPILTCVDPATRQVWPGVAAQSDAATPSEIRPVLAECEARTRSVIPDLQ
jgi:poly-gamma-glutamate synthesis protein (capsule biosynthesis protein)